MMAVRMPRVVRVRVRLVELDMIILLAAIPLPGTAARGTLTGCGGWRSLMGYAPWQKRGGGACGRWDTAQNFRKRLRCRCGRGGLPRHIITDRGVKCKGQMGQYGRAAPRSSALHKRSKESKTPTPKGWEHGACFMSAAWVGYCGGRWKADHPAAGPYPG